MRFDEVLIFCRDMLLRASIIDSLRARDSEIKVITCKCRSEVLDVLEAGSWALQAAVLDLDEYDEPSLQEVLRKLIFVAGRSKFHALFIASWPYKPIHAKVPVAFGVRSKHRDPKDLVRDLYI